MLICGRRRVFVLPGLILQVPLARISIHPTMPENAVVDEYGLSLMQIANEYMPDVVNATAILDKKKLTGPLPSSWSSLSQVRMLGQGVCLLF